MHDKQTKFLMRETTLYYFRLGKFDALCAKPDRLLEIFILAMFL